MKLSFVILVVIVLTILGCGGLGGQGIVVKADRGSSTNVHIYITDGGTKLDGIFYRPKDQLIQNPTTQPNE